MSEPFKDVVTSLDELRAMLGEPSELALRKQLDRLDEHCRTFLAKAPFALLATSDREGRLDVSPKGDPAGFALVLDDTHLVIPDRPGNKRLDGMRNILANPHIGLLFLVPGKDETLRINGRASILRDAELLERMSVDGKRPQLAIGVEIEEVFFHCAKAFRRSGLWKPDKWPDIAALPGPARVFFDQTKPTTETLESLQARLEDGYKNRLY
ncbi:MAG: pyridoxamine 5'-phosphate oxidase family protein [Candidatus Rokubacteria bacterium]|nr:pyridoxamine 5'-phosphate oxidase family protein [Candidatus Rokubacteria bacterium]